MWLYIWLYLKRCIRYNSLNFFCSLIMKWNISLNCPVEKSSPSTAVFSAAKNFSQPHSLSHSIVVIGKTWRELCLHVCSWLCREDPFQVNDSIGILKLIKNPRETEVHVDPGTLALCCKSYPLCVQLNLIAICGSGIFRSIPTQVRAIGQHVLLWWQFGQLQGIARWSLLFGQFFSKIIHCSIKPRSPSCDNGLWWCTNFVKNVSPAWVFHSGGLKRWYQEIRIFILVSDFFCAIVKEIRDTSNVK